MTAIESIAAGDLELAYQRHGRRGGQPVVLLHGFPYDVRCYDAVVPALTARGCDVIVPWLRGFGPTRFRESGTPRSGQQAALAADLVALLDATACGPALLAGYDWGGRAACIVAALFPERVTGLVTGNGHNIQNLAIAGQPASPADERRYWYQYYFHSERGRAGLAANRRALCRLLWAEWSPAWHFDDATYDASACAFDNPDFVEIVIHSYRHRYNLAAGDPALEPIEQAIAAYWRNDPRIAVPTVSLDGSNDGVLTGGGAREHGRFFSGPHDYRLVQGAGHNLPQEKPEAFLAAIEALL